MLLHVTPTPTASPLATASPSRGGRYRAIGQYYIQPVTKSSGRSAFLRTNYSRPKLDCTTPTTSILVKIVPFKREYFKHYDNVKSSWLVFWQSMSNLVVALNNSMEQWSYFNCNVVKGGALTIAGVDQ